jgi:hypothetical protein
MVGPFNLPTLMPDSNQPARPTTRREAILFLVLLALGLVVLPAVIFIVGDAIFGEYGGTGFGDFYGALLTDLVNINIAAWFVVLSPYFVWQLLRMTFAAFRAGKR